MKLAALIIVLVFCIIRPGAAQSALTHQQAHDLFATGNAAYRTQDYDSAAQAYAKLLDAGYETAPVLYNMGTTAARLDQKGEAIGYLMRARKLDPRNDNIRANLHRVDPPVNPEQPNVTGASAESVWARITQFFTTSEWLAIVWLPLMVACFSASAIVLRLHPKILAASRFLLPVSVAIFLFVLIPAISSIYNTRYRPRAVVTSPAEILSGPAERFTKIATVPEGQILTTLRHESEGYTRVKLPNKQQGYINQTSLMKL